MVRGGQKPAFKGVARTGVSHQYTPKLFAFEHIPVQPSSPPKNIIIFIGGLFDGLHTVHYTAEIAAALPPSWTIAQAILSSSYTGWGTSSLQKDAKELSRCVSYFRTTRTGKIIFMGHSTGCQDVLEYITGAGHEDRAPIDGGIIQAAVSDREGAAISIDAEVIKSACKKAQEMVDNGDEQEILPSIEMENMFTCPVSAKRFLSLLSPNHDGDDDMFSSDLTDEQLRRTFGGLPASFPLCVLLSGNDEYLLPGVDQAALLKRWTDIAKRGKGVIDEKHSGIVAGASHNLNGVPQEVVGDLVQRVLGFLDRLSPQSNL